MQHTASFNDASQPFEYQIRLCRYADVPEHPEACFPIKRLALEDGIPSVSKRAGVTTCLRTFHLLPITF